jgi:cytochrome c553
MKSVRWGVLALTASLMCAAAAHADGDAEAGRHKFYTCAGCHGIPNYNNAYPSYRVPKLGGQNAAYIANALHEYKTGERGHQTMHAQAESLSDQDIADIAAYLSTAAEKKE